MKKTVNMRRPGVLVPGFSESVTQDYKTGTEAEHKTIIIFGAPRGGTTMIAGNRTFQVVQTGH